MLAVLGYEKEHGSLPPSLASLTGDLLSAVPLDPFVDDDKALARTLPGSRAPAAAPPTTDRN